MFEQQWAARTESQGERHRISTGPERENCPVPRTFFRQTLWTEFQLLPWPQLPSSRLIPFACAPGKAKRPLLRGAIICQNAEILADAAEEALRDRRQPRNLPRPILGILACFPLAELNICEYFGLEFKKDFSIPNEVPTKN